MSKLKSKAPILLIRLDNFCDEDMLYISKFRCGGEIYKGLRKYFLRRGYNEGTDFNRLTLVEYTGILSKKLQEYGVSFFVFCFDRKYHYKNAAQGIAVQMQNKLGVKND